MQQQVIVSFLVDSPDADTARANIRAAMIDAGLGSHHVTEHLIVHDWTDLLDNEIPAWVSEGARRG